MTPRPAPHSALRTPLSAFRTVPFTKMHGLGNDYVYINCFEQSLEGVDLPALARAVSDRHRGIGSDGLILIRPPEVDRVREGIHAPAAGGGIHAEAGEAREGILAPARTLAPAGPADVRMEMYNADGSRGEMCGNGIRCVAKYAIDHALVSHPGGQSAELRVQTDRGVLTLEAMLLDGLVDQVRVDMGEPILKPADIPVLVEGDHCVKARLPAEGLHLRMTCVSMGNPHAVVFVESLDEIDLSRLGPQVEHDPLFPNRVNLHVVTVQARGEATMRTWERGSGITQACGTGACAVLVAGVLEDRLDRGALVHLPGGDLRIEWTEDARGAGTIYMTGPATEVFSGQWPI